MDHDDTVSAELAKINGRLDTLILRLETRLGDIERFDERLVRVEDVARIQAQTSKTLADAALKLQIAKVVSSPSLQTIVAAVIAGLIGGFSACAFHP